MRVAFESVDQMKWIALPVRVGFFQSVEGLKSKRERKVEFSLCLTVELGHYLLSPPALPVSGLQTQTGIYTIGCLALRPLKYYWPYLVSSLQMVGLLSLHNCVS